MFTDGFILFLLLSSSVIIRSIKYIKYDKISAIINQLDYINQNAYCFYIYNGQYYDNVKIDTYSDQWVLYEPLNAYVNPENPLDMVVVIDLFIFPTIMFIFTLLFGFLAIILLIIRNFIIKSKSLIKKYNHFFIAIIKEFQYLKRYKKVESMQIIATKDDKDYIGNILIGNWEAWQKELNQDELFIRVYYNPNNINQYYLDYCCIMVI